MFWCEPHSTPARILPFAHSASAPCIASTHFFARLALHRPILLHVCTHRMPCACLQIIKLGWRTFLRDCDLFGAIFVLQGTIASGTIASGTQLL